MENTDIKLSDRQLKINVDGKIALVTFHFDDELETISFDVASDDDLSESQIDRVKCTVEKVLLDWFFKVEQDIQEGLDGHSSAEEGNA